MIRLLLLLCIPVVSMAQTISIPDANFKAKLLAADISNTIAYGNGAYTKIDTNSDLEIQLSEALAIDSLNVAFSEIANISGIEAFSNLKKLRCENNQIPVLDVSAIQGLTFLECSNNELTSLNITGLVHLQYLSFNSNMIGTVSLSGFTALEFLFCRSALLTALDLSGLNNLTTVDCSHNLLTSWQVSNLPNLKHLNCANNLGMGSLNLSALPNLESLICEESGLTTLDLSEIPGLKGLYCEMNPMTALDLTGMHSLEMLNCAFNEISSIVLPQPNSIKSLQILGCPITTLDISQAPYLNDLNVAFSPITALDCTNNYNLAVLSIGANPELHTLLIKNGLRQYFSQLQIDGCPNLTYVCADESEVADLVALSGGAFEVNSYCTAVPSPTRNTITGEIFFDAGNDGCQNDVPIAGWGIGVNINDGFMQGSVMLQNCTGNYSYWANIGTYSVTPELDNPALFNVSPPTATLTFDQMNGSTATQNFCITPVGIHPDVEIMFGYSGSPRPGFDNEYVVMYRNKGNQVVSGTVGFGFEDDVLDIVSTNPSPNSASSGILSYNFSNLVPFETREIHVMLNVNGPMEIPPVNLGDVLDFTAAVTINGMTDAYLQDNTAAMHDVVIGSFDPNDKICLEGESVASERIGDYLHYTINFENTGTAAAENVVVRDVIDSTQFEIGSLEVISTSHPQIAQMRINGNRAEFLFNGIQLAPEARGYVVFKIKTKNTLAVNSSVSNKADIFFDYNFPVTTDPAVTVFEVLGTKGFDAGQSVRVYPNPVDDLLRIESDAEILSLQLYDAGGRALSARTGAETSIDVSGYSPGIYYLRVATSKGSKMEKIIKK